jgi:translation initiation factor IF-3
MSFEIEGKLVKKYETESKTGSFQAREFVIEISEGNYPQFVKFQLVQDKCSLLDHLNEGDRIKVNFDLRGREWNGKYFTNLNAWRVQLTGTEPQEPPAPKMEEPPIFPSDEDDLPF